MRHILSILVLLLVMPLLAIFVGWHWEPTASSVMLYPMFLLTETASWPWAVLTSAILAVVILTIMNLPLRIALYLFLIMFATVGAAVAVKSLIKNTVKEPRPYVVWLADQTHSTPENFYQLTKREKQAYLNEALHAYPLVPRWQLTHWKAETSYSFPSGHSVFAALWAFMAVGLLWTRNKIAAVAIVGWAIAVTISRLLLGMHFPSDVITSVFIAAVLAIISCKLMNAVIATIPPKVLKFNQD